MSIVIRVENLSKQYRLGTIGTGTLSHDLNRWWHQIRGKEDPYLKIGSVNDRSSKKTADDYVWALKDVNFEVRQGDVVGIIGRNGAGKSTLLKILSRTTLPTTGAVKVRGRIASLLEVGTGFHPELTGRENIFLNGAILGMRKAEIKRKFDEIIDFAGVEKYVDTPVKRYSSGMYVRLAFAVAAHLDPEILIVDEVLAVGDAEFQKKCLGKMKDVSLNEGRTVLFVSHNMAAIENLCNSCLLLQNGTLTSIGKSQDILSLYLSQLRLNITSKLVDRKDRRGEGGIRFVAVDFFIAGKSVEILSSGKAALIRLYYQALEQSISYSKCRVSVAISKDEKPYIVLSSEMVSDENIVLQDSGHIDFIIDRFPLSKGQYSLTLFVESNGHPQDWIESAVDLNVEDGNYYGVGRNYPLGWEGKTVLVDYKMKIC